MPQFKNREDVSDITPLLANTVQDCEAWADSMRHRYESEFDKVQDVFELQVRS